ncbi:serine/threonine-protein kinase [Streptomyces sp. NBC_01306]|uniref:protein kinase domain-containing protein n=1 Tax=Streptomyces sp. NBC_01306 TaxID=2903819 RepID=UPI002259AA5E|nr:serine/threonine-protein kinase [Streptomyces sp. NBC_01306]MCX4724423.1 protein kinase [Streptomyces sp. NBC_01306]
MAQDPRNSRLIAGRYLLGDRIGRGGMGTVWRATDQLLGREVAVKELNPETGAATASALREARAVAQIKHPQVIVVHDVVVEDDERPYIVMELVVGGSLAARLSERGPVDGREAARIGLALLGALRAAHARGVLHRDIKPANVLLEDDSRVVLTDFGIARLAGATTISETGAFVGSPEYTSPERMQGEEAGPASDLWSLGALLCAAVSGESPFHRDSLGGVLHAVVADEIRPPAEAEPLLPVVLGLLERDAVRRMGVDEAERLLGAYLAACATGGGGGERGSGAEGAGAGVPASVSVPDHPPVPTAGAAPTAGATPLAGAVPLVAATPPAGATPLVAATVPAGVAPPAGATSPADSPPADSPPRSPRPVLRRASLVAGVLAAAAAGAGIVLYAVGGAGAGRTDNAAPSASMTSAPTAASTATPDRGPQQKPHRAAAPGPDVNPTVTLTHQASPAPSGYRVVDDPGGFSLAVPADATRSTDDKRVYYMTPGQVFRIGVRIHSSPGGGPMATQRASDSAGPRTNPGYRDGVVTATTHDGHDAALWEFTWNGYSKGEGARHTYDLCWEQDGRLYDVWVSAPVGGLDAAQRHFATAIGTFSASASGSAPGPASGAAAVPSAGGTGDHR